MFTASLFSSSGLFQVIKPTPVIRQQELPHRALPHQYCKSLLHHALPHQSRKSSHIVHYLTNTAARASHIMPYLTSPARAPTSCPTSPVLQQEPPTSCPTSPVLQELPHRALPHQYCKSSHIMPYLTSPARATTLCQSCKNSHIIEELPGCDQRNSASVMQRTTVFMNLRTSMFVFVLKTNKC